MEASDLAVGKAAGRGRVELLRDDSFVAPPPYWTETLLVLLRLLVGWDLFLNCIPMYVARIAAIYVQQPNRYHKKTRNILLFIKEINEKTATTIAQVVTIITQNNHCRSFLITDCIYKYY